MDWRTILYFSSTLLTCILTGFLAWYAWRQPPQPGVRIYAIMVLGECLLALTDILSMLGGNETQARIWFNMRFFFNATIPILFYIFAMEYFGHKDWLSTPLRVTAFVIPVISQIILWSNNLHGLWVLQEVEFQRHGPFWIADTSVRIPSLWFMVHSFYAILMMLVGIAVVLVSVWHNRRISRQGLLLSAGTLIALISGMIPIFNLLPLSGFNPLIPGIGISALLYALAIFRFQFLKRPPTGETTSRLTRLAVQEKQSLAVFTWIFILFVSGFATASYLAYENYERQLRAQVEGQLSAIAELKVNELENWRKERLADAEIFHNNPAFIELARRFQENPDNLQAREQLQAWLNIVRSSYQYDRIFLLDAAGVEQISSPATSEMVPDSFLEQSAVASMASDQVILLDFHRHSEKENIHLSMMVPIHEAGNNKQMLGVLVIWINPQTYLYPLIQSWPVPSKSAESLLVRQKGENILFLSPLRFHDNAALNLQVSMENPQLPAVKAALGQTGIVEGLDYRGVEVIADIRPVPASPWFLVSKMDAAEVYGPIRERLWQIILFFSLLIVATGAGLAMLWNQQRMQYYRSQIETVKALQASEEKFRLAFDTSPDSLAITRMSDGKLISINKGFEQLTGYTREEAIGNTSIGLSLWKYPEDRQKVVGELMAGRKVENFESTFNTRRGEITGLMSATLIELDGEPHILNIVRDITQRKQAEEALRLAEENYRSIFENALEGIFQSLPEGRFIKVNPAFARMLGYESPQELIETVTDIASQTYFDSPRRAEFIHIMEEKGSVTGFEFQMKRKDGRMIWVNESARAVRDGAGNLLYYEGAAEDITERKRMEQVLREGEEIIRLAYDAAQLGTWKQDIATQTFHFDKRARQHFDLDEAKPPLETLASRIHPKDVVRFREKMKEMDTPSFGDRLFLEYRVIHRDGSVHWIAVHARIHFEEDAGKQKAILLTGTSQEITERKQAEDKLHESLHNLEEAERISHVGHYEIDVQTGKAIWSREVFRIFGRDPSLGEPTVEEYGRFTHPEDAAAVYEMYARSINEGIPFDLVYRIMKADGQIRYVHSQAETARNEQGQITKIFGTFQDITGQRQADENLQTAHEFLQGVQDSLSAHIAILNAEGVIVQVNTAWRNFGDQNELKHPNYCIGANYLEVCDTAKGPGAEEAALAAEAIRKVLGGAKKNAWFEYACHGQGHHRWFIARITSFENDNRTWVVISHENITARKQIEERLQQRIAELEVLYENSLAFTQSFNPHEIAQKMIELLGEKLDWHHTAIRLLNEESDTLELAAFDLNDGDDSGQSASSERLQKVVTHIDEGLSGWAIQQGKTLRVDNVAGNAHYVASYPGIRSGMYAPLKAGEKVLGVISIESEKPDAFSESDEQLISTLANQVAIALENARLYREVRRHAGELEKRVQERTAEIDSTRQRLELAVKTAGLGIWELDLQSGEELWDDRTYALRGFSREQSHSSEETWRKAIHPQDLPQVVKRMEQTLRDNEPYDPEYRVILPGNKLRYIKTTAVVLYDEQGKPSRMLGADQDITLHKKAEEALLQANAEMERSLRMKTEFLATMSHELRTPLNSILGISESLEEQIAGSLNEKQLKYVRIINESGHHLLELINDILDLSKIEAGKLELTIETISVEKLCNASLRMIKELAQKKSLNVSFKMDPRAKYISGDERRLKQILVNLLSNAVKFTPSGREIGLEVRPNEETHELKFTVWDQGIGIAEEDMKHLFQPFIQLQSGLAREYGGSGLGLALVAQMARLHGGNVTLKSKLDFGSRFTVALPWSLSETGHELKMTAPLEAKAGQRVSGNAKILIVEDTEVVAHLVSEYLQHKGYQTRTAGNGLEGILKAKQEHPQIILMDVMMPEMNGLDATRKLRADPDMKDVIIIGLTALAMPSDREQCIAAGMNDHISKPIQMQELAKIIEHHLRQNG